MQDIQTFDILVNEPFNRIIQVMQNDVKSRYIRFCFKKDETTLLDITNHTVRMYAVTQNGTKIFNDLTIENAELGIAILELTSQMLSAPGRITLQLSIYGADSSILSTKTLNLYVDRSIRDDAAIESVNEFTVLTNALNSIKQAKADVGVVGSLKEALDKSTTTAEQVKTNIDDSTVLAAQKKVVLDESIGIGTTLEQNLEDDITAGNALKSDLDDNIAIGTSLKNDLNTSISNGTTLKQNLDNDIATGSQLKTGLDTNIQTGVKLKADLETDIATAGQKKTDLEGVVKTANLTTYASKQEFNQVSAQLAEKESQLSGRIDNIVSGVTQDSEVIDARNSVLKSKTFASLDARLGEIEADTKEATSNRLNLPHYDEIKGEYVNLDKFWDNLRNGKKYTVEFNQYSVSPSSLGTKKDDNTGLVCEPSTNTVKGRNDYENIGLFMAIDVNGYVDENDNYHVTAIKGDGRFKADGSNGDVWVMSMVGYTKYYSTDTVWGLSYADVLFPGYEVIQEAIKPDGTIRSFLLHAKYIAGLGKDGKLASVSGVYPEWSDMSHNTQITKFKAKGAQYSGKTSHDDFYVSMMFYLKYATLNQESIMKGCISYYLQYKNIVAEIGVKRVIITSAQARTLIVGSCVSIGDFEGSTQTDDRQQARNYNKANRVKITSIEDLGNGNSAIYVDSATTFDTTLATTITTYPWQSGACDNVLGADGSPYSNTSGKEPCMVNGIEFMVGGYEIIQNLIIYNDNTNPDDYNIKVYACYDCKKYATSPTADYDLVSNRIAKTNESWAYITKIGIDLKHPSVIVPVEAGGSSTTGFADGLYSNKPVTGYREWRSLGLLSRGSVCGLRYLRADIDLSLAYWAFLGRLSATGRSRRRAGVN